MATRSSGSSEELGIGLAAGIAGGLVLIWALRATRHLEEGVQAVVVVLGAVLLGALTATLHGSGFLAVYIAGLLLSDAWSAKTELNMRSLRRCPPLPSHFCS